MTCHECGSHEHTLHDCPRWNDVLNTWVEASASTPTEGSNPMDLINVYIVLNTGKMIEAPWSDEYESDSFEPVDACEQASQKVRAGTPIYGRLIGEDGKVSETFRYFAVEPRSVEMVFTNA